MAEIWRQVERDRKKPWRVARLLGPWNLLRFLARRMRLEEAFEALSGRREIEPDAEDHDAITNPCLIVEVLSPSTEDYDRGEKLAAYKLLPSVREIVFVAHDVRRIDVVRRRGNDWIEESYGHGELAPLEVAGSALEVADVYFDPLSTSA